MKTLGGAVVSMLFAVTATSAPAQDAGRVAPTYPSKPVRVIVSSAPGGGQDVTTRPVAQKLGEAFGVPVSFWKSSIPRLCRLPGPEVPYVSVPGLLRT